MEAERIKILREKDDLIKKFENEILFDDIGSLRKNIKEKKYVDGSKYVGEVLND